MEFNGFIRKRKIKNRTIFIFFFLMGVTLSYAEPAKKNSTQEEGVPTQLLNEIEDLTILPKDQEGWDRWDDWALFSRESANGLSFAVSPGLGNIDLHFDGSQPAGGVNVSSGGKFFVHLPARLFYGFKSLPWIQPSWLMSMGIAPFSASGDRNFMIPVHTGPGFQIRFVRFPPLAPLYIGAELPLGFVYVTSGSKNVFYTWGYEITTGLELAVSDRHSVGFRFVFSNDFVMNDSFLKKFQKLSAGLEYRYYFKTTL